MGTWRVLVLGSFGGDSLNLLSGGEWFRLLAKEDGARDGGRLA